MQGITRSSWQPFKAICKDGKRPDGSLRSAIESNPLQILWLVVKCFGRFCVNSLGVIGGILVGGPAQLGHFSGYGANGLDRGEAFGLMIRQAVPWI